MIAPLDVQLDRDDRTMVQPDVLVVCDRSKGGAAVRLRGAGFCGGDPFPIHMGKGYVREAW